MLNITEDKKASVLIVGLNGRLDASTAKGLEDQLQASVNENEEFFSTDHLRGFLETVPDACPEDLIRGIVAEVRRFSSGAPQADNSTIVALRYQGKNQYTKGETS